MDAVEAIKDRRVLKQLTSHSSTDVDAMDAVEAIKDRRVLKQLMVLQRVMVNLHTYIHWNIELKKSVRLFSLAKSDAINAIQGYIMNLVFG
ncbi:hypothetical protein QE152_g26538 [Popillia japonica]|uniref:Uncharacterized protein n=1 Tax=Popillia japonica TaxID=7064 RepID=A0AAW1JYK5_POPJA